MPNGLNVLMAPRPGSGVVTVDMWVHTGSADETPELNGASHFLEHMLFKGAKRYGLGQIDREIEGMGGLVNAATSHDYTHYHITVASDNTPRALDILADMIMDAELDPAEIDNERQVIIEEYLIKQDSPQGVLWEEIYLRAFDEGPYRLPVLGTPETLNNIGRAELRDYYERHYAPENMALIIVGDIDPEKVYQAVDAHFGGFKRPYVPRKSDFPTRYATAAEHILEKDIHESYGIMAFPIPAMGDHSEAYILDVMQFVLGGGEASMLYQELKEKQRLVTSIGASYPNSRYDDLFYIHFTCDEAKRPEVVQAVYEQLELLQKKPTPEGALKRARKLLANDHLFNLETTDGESGSLGYFYTITGDVAYERNYVDGVMSVSPEQVQESARKWLSGRDSIRLALRPTH